MFIDINDIIASRLKMRSSIITFCHKNLKGGLILVLFCMKTYIITSWLTSLWMVNILCIDKFLFNWANKFEGGLELGLMVRRLGRGGDEGQPLVLCRDIVRRRHTAYVDV